MANEVKIVINGDARHQLDGSLGKALDYLQEKYNSIPEDLRHSAVLDISPYDEYGSPSVDIGIWYFRPETDDERLRREAEEARLAKVRQDRELAMLRELQAKYGDAQ